MICFFASNVFVVFSFLLGGGRFGVVVNNAK